jgi:hypothetical protein
MCGPRNTFYVILYVLWSCIGNVNKDKSQAYRKGGRTGDILCNFEREKTTTSKMVTDPFTSNGTGRQLLDVDFSPFS